MITRLHAPVRDWVAGLWVVTLPGSPFNWPLAYNPGGALLLACLVAWVMPGAPKGLEPGWRLAALRDTLRQWAMAALSVLVLLVMARAMESGGMFLVLAQAAAGLPPWLGLSVLPILSALGGFATGSVAAANGLFLTFQVEAAQRLGLQVVWAVGVHTAIAAAFTAFSPARLVFAAVLTGQTGREGEALRRLWVLAVLLLVWGVLALTPWMMSVWEGAGGLLPVTAWQGGVQAGSPG